LLRNLSAPNQDHSRLGYRAQTNMEIIVFPYMAISFFIGWAIFSPFADIEDLDCWTFAKIETSDLFGAFLPISFLLAIFTWRIETNSISVFTWSFVAIASFLISLFGFVVGLYVLAKMKTTSPFKRMAMIGIVIPMGTLLTFAWIAFPLFGFANSIVHAFSATLLLIPVTWAFRVLSCWVCTTSSRAG